MPEPKAPADAPGGDITGDERERQLAVKVGEGGKPAAIETVWVISNRKDDRVVLFERDPRHPGGEAFLGGAGPDHVAMTDEVRELLRQGLIVQIPEPPDTLPGSNEPNPFKPVPTVAQYDTERPAQPGQPVPLGREINPALLGQTDRQEVARAQAQAPSEIRAPSGSVTPPPTDTEKTTARR